jgi:3'(2'), 5'-bisphosphate nucleotidase
MSLLPLVVEAAREAGREILRVYASDFAVTHKDDRSPVTAADHAAQDVILARLEATGIPVVSEEHPLPDTAAHRFWLVDPLDGTKEFVARNDEFSVNIALVEDGYPVLGVIHAPVTGVTWTGGNGRAARDGAPIAARVAPERIVVIHSRSHANSAKLADFLGATPVAERKIAGSATKFCFVAQGDADLYPRLGPTSEWDTAAGQAILEAAGGSVTDLEGRRLSYGKPNFLNPSFIARGRTR